MLKPRNRELLGLIPAALLVTAGFTAIFIQEQNTARGADTNLVLGHAFEPVADVWGDLPRAVRGGAPCDPLCAAQR